MTPNDPDPATVIGIGLAVLLALATALWKAAALRGDVNRTWSKRVDAATAALTNREIGELQALRRETDRLLGDPEDESPPILSTVDPAPLVRRAEAVARYAKTRETTERSLRLLLRVAPLLIPALLLITVGTTLVTLNYADLARFEGVCIAGLVLLSMGGLPAVALFGLYLLAQHRLSGAEIMGDQPPAED